MTALTGLTGQHLGELLRQLWALHLDTGRGRPWGLSFPDRVLIATVYLRTNLTERELAVLFGVSQKQVDRVLHDLMALPSDLLATTPGPTRAADRRRHPDHDEGSLAPRGARTTGVR